MDDEELNRRGRFCSRALVFWPAVVLSFMVSLLLPPARARGETPLASQAAESYRLATGLYNMKLFEEAAEKYREFLKRYPEHPNADRAQYRLGDCLVNMKSFDEALVAFRSGIDRYPRSAYRPEALFRLGELNQLLGKTEKAVAAYQRFLDEHREHRLLQAVRRKLGLAHLAAGRPAEAAEMFRAFLKNEPDLERSASVRLGLARALTALGKRSKAILEYEKIAEGFPEKAEGIDARIELLFLYVADGQEKAAVERARNDSRRGDTLGQEAQYLLGFLAFRNGNHRKAAERFETLIRRFPETARIEESRLLAARSYLQLKDDAKALAHLDHIGKLVADEVGYFRGTILAKQEKTSKARKAFLAVVQRHPKSKYRPFCLFELGRLDEGEGRRFWEQLLNESPGSEPAGEAAIRWASALARQGKNGDALALLEKIPPDSPRRTGADLLRVQLLSEEDLGKAAELLSALKKRGANGKELSRARYAVGLAAAEKGKPRLAAAQLEAVLSERHCPDLHPDCLYQLGLAHENLGEKRKAQARYEECSTKHKRSVVAPSALLRLGALQAPRDRAEAAKTLEGLVRNYPTFRHLDQALFILGRAYAGLKKTEKAREVFTKLLTAYPKSATAPEALLQLGLIAGEPREAIRLLTKGREKAGEEDLKREIQYRLAWALYKGENCAEAASIFDGLREHETYGAESAYLAGICWQDAGRPEEAVRAFESLLKRHPRYEHAEEVPFLIGESLLGAKRWRDAAGHYGPLAERLKDERRRARAELGLGVALYQLNHLARAEEALKRAAERGDPSIRAKATFFLGEAALLQKKYRKAKEHFLKVAVLYKDDHLTPAALLEAAKALAKIGRDEETHKVLERLLDEYPDSPSAGAAREMLKETRAGSSGKPEG